MKALILAASVLALGACAKSQPLPQECPTIPINLVNVSDNVVIKSIPEQPSEKDLVRITSRDRADLALGKVLAYTADLKEHDEAVTDIANTCITEIVDREKRLKAIKQYILLSQPK